MKKRGFTLVELLAVLVILAVVIALVFPTISSVLKRSKETINDVQTVKLLNAAYDYTLKNSNILPNTDETKYITLAHLKKARLIDANFINSKTNEPYAENLVISIKNVTNYHKTEESKNSFRRGNYLYTIEKDFMNSAEFELKKPTIAFEGYDELPVVVTINIGDSYVPLTYKVTSNEELTSLVVENITYNSNFVDEIDTFDAGIYYINYSVIDEDGYSNSETVSLIVVDSEKPELIIPDHATISADVTYYDLMKDVSCTDNSKKCDISVDGSINYGVVGKYSIEYKASDPTGNTTTLKRVITVE